jgi:hypothetical protein
LGIAPLVYEKAGSEQKAILREQYGVAPFPVETIRVERIFVDKIFASEFYFERKDYFDVSKHIYDLAVMAEMQEIQAILLKPKALAAMIALKRREEKARIGSSLSEKPISDFEFFTSMRECKALRSEFQAMQSIYVFSEADRLNYDAAASTLSSINAILKNENTSGFSAG